MSLKNSAGRRLRLAVAVGCLLLAEAGPAIAVPSVAVPGGVLAAAQEAPPPSPALPPPADAPAEGDVSPDDADAPSAAALAAGAALVEEYLTSLDTVRARFLQALHDAQGRLQSESRGEMLLRRPGRLRWEVQTPYPQLLVADGEALWVYDPDLEQVTVRALAATLADTPASLLVNEGDFRERFVVTAVRGDEATGRVVRLEPRDGAGDFVHVDLTFRDGELVRMEATDRLDQRTRITFEDVERGLRLRRSLFRFRPPADADVIDRRDAGRRGSPEPDGAGGDRDGGARQDGAGGRPLGDADAHGAAAGAAAGD